MSEQQAEAITAVRSLATSVDELGDDVGRLQEAIDADREASKARDADLKSYGQTSRILAVVAVLAVVAAVVALLVAIHASSSAAVAEAKASVNQQVATAQHAELIAGCRASNQLKARQATVWTFIEQFLGPKPGQTAAQKAGSAKFLDALEQHVTVAYAPRNCSAAYRPLPAPADPKSKLP